MRLNKRWFRSDATEAVYTTMISLYLNGAINEERIRHFEDGCIRPEAINLVRAARAKAKRKLSGSAGYSSPVYAQPIAA
ncbi:MAG: hypothetical protein LBM77_08825 [Spirochaetaceae bacterium]|jgi:hypothetical protein|nr:hypothetical protein [Spirochaetaceae bacterium]